LVLGQVCKTIEMRAVRPARRRLVRKIGRKEGLEKINRAVRYDRCLTKEITFGTYGTGLFISTLISSTYVLSLRDNDKTDFQYQSALPPKGTFVDF
jgi:hypothetical protein